MIYIGDTHGKTSQLEWMLRHNPKLQGKRSFQLGDMGLGFKGVTLRQFERERFLFIRGNHDNPQFCAAHPNYAGEYGYLEDENLFFLGGAWSIDAAWRIPGISWWPDEEQSPEALNAAFQLYVKSKPRIVATHETPTSAAITMLNGLMMPKRTESGYTDATREKGEDYEYYKAKLGCAETRTSQYLQQMFDAHQPEHWVFGHYHVRRDFTIKGTQFHCLPELATLEVNLEVAV
jgi:Calcineurin-like phosphoesterase